jgi:hypothetical protein
MVGPSADLTIEWEGGSLSELVSALQSAALPVRIEVIAPGTTDSNAGEVHLLAGGLADAFAGSLRRDDAMAALQRLEGARYLVEARLPDPETGSLSTAGPHEGSLADRPVAALMRYCEDYVLTCRVEVWRGQERAVISYQRGEIISTSVGGSEGSESLPEVMRWTDGSYQLVLPAPVLPPAPSRKGAARSVEPLAKGERKRHSTLPMTPGSSGAGQAAASSAGTSPAAPTPPRPAPSAPPPARPAPSAPAQAGKPATVPTGTPGVPAPAAPPASGVAAKPGAGAAGPAAPAAQQPGGRQPSTTQQLAGRQPGAPPPANHPAAPSPATAQPVRPAGPAHAPVQQPARAASPAATGSPVAVSRVPATAQPAAQQSGARPGVGQPSVQQGQARQPAQAPQPAPAAAPVQPAAAKPHVRTLTPAMGSMTARPPAEPLGAELTTRGTPPVPAVPLIPAPPARPASHPTPSPIAPAKPASPAGGGESIQPTSARPDPTNAATPPPVPVAPTPPPFQLAQPARPTKQPLASNDLKPASGTIEAKNRHSNHLPPVAAPIEIADQPEMAQQPEPVSQAVAPSRPSAARRARAERKGLGEQSVKVYVLIGLAIGAGIVVAYWAYWYLPFFHH